MVWGSIVIGVLVSIIIQVFFSSDTHLSSLLQYGVLGGLLGGLWYGPNLEKRQEHPWEKILFKRMALSACVGLFYGLSFGFNLSSFYTLNDWQTHGFSYGVAIGLVSLILQYLLTRPFHPHKFSGNRTLRQWQRVIRFGSQVQGLRALLIAVVTGLILGLSAGPSFGLNLELTTGLSLESSLELSFRLNYGFNFGLSTGLSYALISLILGTQTENIQLTDRIRWNWRGLFISRHLRITALLTCTSII